MNWQVRPAARAVRHRPNRKATPTTRSKSPHSPKSPMAMGTSTFMDSSRREQCRHRSLPRPAAHFDLAAWQADIDLGADAKSPRQVNAGLDGKARLGQVPARVVGLEVVVVHAVAVAVHVDAVAGA